MGEGKLSRCISESVRALKAKDCERPVLCSAAPEDRLQEHTVGYRLHLEEAGSEVVAKALEPTSPYLLSSMAAALGFPLGAGLVALPEDAGDELVDLRSGRLLVRLALTAIRRIAAAGSAVLRRPSGVPLAGGPLLLPRRIGRVVARQVVVIAYRLDQPGSRTARATAGLLAKLEVFQLATYDLGSVIGGELLGDRSAFAIDAGGV